MAMPLRYPTPAMFKETARSETSLTQQPTSGGRVVGVSPTPPLGGGGGGGLPLSGVPPSLATCFKNLAEDYIAGKNDHQ